MKRDHSNSSSHLNNLLLSPPPPPPSSLELLLLERAKALQQHHQNTVNNSGLKPSFPHFSPHVFSGGLRSGLFPTAPLPSNLPALLAGGGGENNGGFGSRPEVLLQRWRQQLPSQLPANIQEDSRMDITTAATVATTTQQQSSTPKLVAIEQPNSFARPERSPSPPAASPLPTAAASSPPPSDVPPAVLNGEGRPSDMEEDEAVTAAMGAEDEESATVVVEAPSEEGTASPGRYHDNSSPVKSEDSNLGELMTPQLPAMSPLSPYSSCLPTLLSSASRLDTVKVSCWSDSTQFSLTYHQE